MDPMTKRVEVSRIDVANKKVRKREDVVARENPLHIFLGEIHFISILCSPTLLKELVVGYLLGEGLVSSIDEIVSVDFDREKRCHVILRKTDVEKRVVVSKPFGQLIVSNCGSVGYRSLSDLLKKIDLKPLLSWQIKARTVLECVRLLNALGGTFRKTGGVHVAALFEHHNGDLIMLAEDVGRHNAVDKVIGATAIRGKDLGKCFLALSGRLSGDIVLKAARLGIPVVASLAAPVDTGVEVAEKTGVTLVGFVRGRRMNVYSGLERIAF